MKFAPEALKKGLLFAPEAHRKGLLNAAGGSPKNGRRNDDRQPLAASGGEGLTRKRGECRTPRGSGSLRLKPEPPSGWPKKVAALRPDINKKKKKTTI